MSIWLLVKEPLRKAAGILVLLLAMSQVVFAASATTPIERDIYYAILPGIAVGTIALGTPEALARTALLRYGTITEDPDDAIVCAVQPGHSDAGVCFQLKDGKVVATLAVGRPWYVVTSQGVLPLEETDAAMALGILGNPDCEGGPAAFWDDLGLFLVLNNDGIVHAAGVYGTSLCGGES